MKTHARSKTITTRLAILDAVDGSLAIHQVHKVYKYEEFRRLGTEFIEKYITEVLGYNLSNIEWSLVKDIKHIDDTKLFPLIGGAK